MQDLPKLELIEDTSVSRQLVISPCVPNQIRRGTDVQRLYDVSVMSLWGKMQHPELRAFQKICLKHFIDEALKQPHFVKSYLPLLALCSILVVEGKVTIPWSPQLMLLES